MVMAIVILVTKFSNFWEFKRDTYYKKLKYILTSFSDIYRIGTGLVKHFAKLERRFRDIIESNQKVNDAIDWRKKSKSFADFVF